MACTDAYSDDDAAALARERAEMSPADEAVWELIAKVRASQSGALDHPEMHRTWSRLITAVLSCRRASLPCGVGESSTGDGLPQRTPGATVLPPTRLEAP
jgi:hypothetical protein